jgi:hypothetical protein
MYHSHFHFFFNRGWERQGPRAMGALENEMAPYNFEVYYRRKGNGPVKTLKMIEILENGPFHTLSFPIPKIVNNRNFQWKNLHAQKAFNMS